MTTTLLFLLLSVVVFIAMYLLKKTNKFIHFVLIGISMAVLMATQFVHFDKSHSFTLILLMVLFGNFYRNYRKSI
ncbi:MAG: hypothetical protein KA736_01375 [Crocinitomicaceae bacterium]|nr:hypothetical protein [Crocinitomicaceae bacterium]MBP6032698.1 hypothetical protein [Crocinitomicaceae bacterium]